MKQRYVFPISLMCGLLLGGCAVKPVSMTKEERAELIQSDLVQLFADQEPVAAPMTLYEAMARAIKYNLDHRVQLMEEALRRGQLETAHADLLPSLTLSAGYTRRDNTSASSSESVATGNESLVSSTSQDREYHTFDGVFVWNVLDFGVSYAQAKQHANEVLISEEKRRKVVQNIMQDVRYAFWRAVSAERLLPLMDRLLLQADKALERVTKLEKMRVKSPLTYLNYRKELITLVRKMWRLREELASARAEFSALVNLRPGQEFQLVAPEDNQLEIPQLDISIDHLESYALAHRPEIREEQYQSRISAEEVRKAMLRMLPGLELRFGTYYDSNSFLLNEDWTQAGVRLSWNIFNLFNGQKVVDAARSQQALDDMRRLSLQMAVLAQVHLSSLRYAVAKKSFTLSDDLNKVEQKIQAQMAASKKAKMENELEVLRTQVSALVARMNRDLSYAELQNSMGRIQSSIGLDPLPEDIQGTDLNALSKAIEERLNGWRGQVGS